MIHTLITTQPARSTDTSVQVRNKAVFPLVELGARKTRAVEPVKPAALDHRQHKVLRSRPNFLVVGANDN